MKNDNLKHKRYKINLAKINKENNFYHVIRFTNIHNLEI